MACIGKWKLDFMRTCEIIKATLFIVFINNYYNFHNETDSANKEL